MRVTQILSSQVYGRKMPSKAAPKQNISFGLIEKENRDKILAHLPEEDEWKRNYDINSMDKLYGAIVRWGGRDCPRGLIYADLISKHVEKSQFKDLYEEMTLDHLEKEKNYKNFVTWADCISTDENPDGTYIERETPSSTGDYDPTAGDNTMKAYDLYGAP